MKPIYLDYNATTPISREVADAMAPYLYEHFGNPSSSHPYGVAAKAAVEKARGQVASLIGCEPDEIVFTSGGTEANNFAIIGAARANRAKGNHIITSAIEHPAVSEVCTWLEREGFRVTILPVDGEGLVDPSDLERAITDDTILVTVMHANNEVGTIEPIAELAAIAHGRGALMHTDAAQSLGKVPVDVGALGADLLSIAGHKLYAPKGIGALYLRGDLLPARLMHGASHENGRRPGTENVLEIVGLGAACAAAARDLTQNRAHFAAMRDRLHRGLEKALGTRSVRLNGHPDLRLPNTLSVCFRGVEANTLVAEIGDRVAASAGAACHADEVDVSVVLEAMKVPIDWAMGTLRLSTGRSTTAEEVDEAVAIVADAVGRLMPEGDAACPVAAADREEIKLTRYTHGLGCACKLRPQELEKVLAALPKVSDPDVVVGTDTSDDAAAYRIDDETLIVQTVVFFTPVVDDPYLFGAISAANSLSDVYAMGARPLFALNIVGFPSNRLPMSVLEKILRGALDKAAEAGISIVGGHTVDDTEPKFGLAVTGVVHPDRLLRNVGAAEGDVLVLTKPLGMGILSTALKQGLADATTAREAAGFMAALNRAAAETLTGRTVHACTDVTGFGLLGHLHEMAAGSGVDVVLTAGAVPVLAAAEEFAAAGVVPGGTLNNLDHVQPHVAFGAAVTRTKQILLADAQTSGGLLISLPESECDSLLDALRKAGIGEAARIGRAAGPGKGRITVEE